MSLDSLLLRTALPAAAAILAISASANAQDDSLAHQMSRVDALSAAGRYDEAIALSDRLIAGAKQRYTEKHDVVTTLLDQQGWIHAARRDYGKAKVLFHKSLSIRLELHGEAHHKVVESYYNLGNMTRHLGDEPESVAMYRRSIHAYERAGEPADAHRAAAAVLSNLAITYRDQGRFPEAEAAFERARKVYEKAYGPFHPKIVTSLNAHMLLHLKQGTAAKALPLAQRALQINEKLYGPEHPEVAGRLNDLSNLYARLGNYPRAVSLLQRSLRINEKTLGANHPDYANNLNNLAIIYRDQSRHAEAEALYLEAIRIREKSGGPNDADLATILNNLGLVYRETGRLKEAELLLQRALDIYEKEGGRNSPDVAMTLSNLGKLRIEEGRYAAAETIFKEALKIDEDNTHSEHEVVAFRLSLLASLYLKQNKLAEARAFIDRALQIGDQATEKKKTLASYYQISADVFWGQNRRDAAVADLQKAIELAERQRADFAGAADDRAKAFAGFASYFETMVGWQRELGNINAAVSAMEQGRARSLLDLVQLHGADLLAGLPPNEAAALRRRDEQAKSRLAALSRQLEYRESTGKLSADDRASLKRDIADAQKEAVEAYAAIRNASPAVRLALGGDLKAIELDALSKWVADQNGALLQYLIGEEHSFLLIVAASEAPRLIELEVSQELAQRLGATAGPLTAERLGEAMRVGDREIQQHLSHPQLDEKAIDRLAALYLMLIPEELRKSIAGEGVERLFVIPDGALATLPFEVLVTEATDAPRYLLDDGPPIVAAPSSTLLVNLHNKPAADTSGERFQVLTVADPVYGEARSNNSADATPSSRYAAVGGRLAGLPHSGTESKWIGKLFQDAGLKPGFLHKEKATEAALRSYCSGKKILHVACHGLVDQEYGNFFGSLALTPGRSSAGANDDGFLTLPEIYELDLDGCELTILSACSTNFGPTQKGEGVWALSRGFLVAGSRRVVASDWLVDDKASASLISYYCGAIANSEKKGEPVDYAAALHAAKRWTRSQNQWQSPYYWGPFVHVGPK